MSAETIQEFVQSKNQQTVTNHEDQIYERILDNLDTEVPLSKKKVWFYKNLTAEAQSFYSCKFDPQDKLIAASSLQGSICVFPLYRNENIPSLVLQTRKPDSDLFTSLRWKPQNNSNDRKQVLVSASTDGKIIQWDISSGHELYSLSEKGNTNMYLDYNVEGTLFASGGQDRIIRVYNDDTKKVVNTLKATAWPASGHSNRVLAVKFHPKDPNMLISAGWDRSVYMWDLRSNTTIGNIYGPAVSAESLDMDGNTILTGSNRDKNQLELWDFGSRKKISEIEWRFDYSTKNATVQTCQFSKADRESIIAGCSNLNQLKVFDRRDQNKDFDQIENGNLAVQNIDFANQSSIFCYVSGDGVVRVSKIIEGF